jgi:hypothetical protein
LQFLQNGACRERVKLASIDVCGLARDRVVEREEATREGGIKLLAFIS